MPPRSPRDRAGSTSTSRPQSLPSGHGAAIQWRKLTGKAVLKSAASNRLLLYRSESANGDAVAVSGHGRGPEGQGAQGRLAGRHAGRTARSASPTRARRRSPACPRQLRQPAAELVAEGRATRSCGPTTRASASPDVTHPYLIGVSEGRSVLDMVRAARKLDPTIGKNVVLAGHSQGGHAALWANSLAKKYTPDLKLRGTLAFAPASHIGEQASLLTSLTTRAEPHRPGVDDHPRHRRRPAVAEHRHAAQRQREGALPAASTRSA